jgi:hypothetical protein
VPPIVTCFSCIASRGLHLCRRAVDLVGQDDVGEDRPLLHHELPRRLIVDLRAEHVGRQEVGGELDAGEGGVDRLGEGPDGERLREPRDPLEQHVPAGEEADEQTVDHVALSDDAQRDLAADVLDQARVGAR